MKKKIICTIGPSSSNKEVLSGLKKNGVDIFRINLSHTSLKQLSGKINLLKKNNIKNICIDTEGAQVRTTKVKKKIFFKKNKKVDMEGYYLSEFNFFSLINIKAPKEKANETKNVAG